ncbi:MAG: hypothetical protein ACRC1L_04905 [Prochlorococcaceae cyanobacterium]
MSAADELKRLEREIEGADRKPPQPPGEAKLLKAAESDRRRSISFDIALAACALLISGSVGIYWVRQMDADRARALQNGLTGAAVGLMAGYAVGRLRP